MDLGPMEPVAATAARGAQPQGSLLPPSPLAKVCPGEARRRTTDWSPWSMAPWSFSSYNVAAPCLPAAGAPRRASLLPVFRAARQGGRSSHDRIRI